MVAKPGARRIQVHTFHFQDTKFLSAFRCFKSSCRKEEQVRRGKIVKQRRIMLDTLSNLYIKFKAEYGAAKISFTTFWRYKPFWLMPPKDSDRDTCQCKSCENFQFFADAMFKLGALQTAKRNVLVHQSACDIERKECFFGQCLQCHSKQLPTVLNVPSDQHCVWNQWVSVKEERTLKDGKNKTVTLTKKVDEGGTEPESL